jgi:hypothetical protein
MLDCAWYGDIICTNVFFNTCFSFSKVFHLLFSCWFHYYCI